MNKDIMYAIIPTGKNAVKILVASVCMQDPDYEFIMSMEDGWDHITSMEELFVAMNRIQCEFNRRFHYERNAFFQYLEEDLPDQEDIADNGDRSHHWDAPGIRRSDFF